MSIISPQFESTIIEVGEVLFLAAGEIDLHTLDEWFPDAQGSDETGTNGNLGVGTSCVTPDKIRPTQARRPNLQTERLKRVVPTQPVKLTPVVTALVPVESEHSTWFGSSITFAWFW